MMFCSKCGAQLPDNASFCAKCGNPCGQPADGQQNSWQAQQNPNSWNQPGAAAAKPALSQEEKQARLFRILSYIPILFWIPMALNPMDEEGRKTGNQGLLLLIIDAAAWLINAIFSLVFFVLFRFAPYSLFGVFHVISIIVSVIVWLLVLLTVVCAVIGIVMLTQGKFFELPVIGKFQIIKPLPKKTEE